MSILNLLGAGLKNTVNIDILPKTRKNTAFWQTFKIDLRLTRLTGPTRFMSIFEDDRGQALKTHSQD
jgi:hypothetical protein